MALITCPHCGKQVSDSTTFCEHCGKELKIEGQNELQQKSVEVLSKMEETEQAEQKEKQEISFEHCSAIKRYIIKKSLFNDKIIAVAYTIGAAFIITAFVLLFTSDSLQTVLQYSSLEALERLTGLGAERNRLIAFFACGGSIMIIAFILETVLTTFLRKSVVDSLRGHREEYKAYYLTNQKSYFEKMYSESGATLFSEALECLEFSSSQKKYKLKLIISIITDITSGIIFTVIFILMSNYYYESLERVLLGFENTIDLGFNVENWHALLGLGVLIVYLVLRVVISKAFNKNLYAKLEAKLKS